MLSTNRTLPELCPNSDLEKSMKLAGSAISWQSKRPVAFAWSSLVSEAATELGRTSMLLGRLYGFHQLRRRGDCPAEVRRATR